VQILAKTFRLTLRSTTKQIGRVETFVNKIGRFAHLDEIQMHKLMIAVTEAANNAIIHGNKQDKAKKVKLTCEVCFPWLVVTVVDEGKGFNPKKVESPLRKKNLLKESGRGIFLMRTLMDKVDYRVGEHGVRVQLWLDLNKK
jgi:serine/threonine-protein kinase RsbW